MTRLRFLFFFALVLLMSQVALAQGGYGYGYGHDWSKVAFNVGAGVNVPVGTGSDFLTPGWTFNAGGGFKPDRHLSLGLDFNYDHWKLNSRALGTFDVPAGHTNVWSLTFNPTYNFYPRSKVDFYTTAGYGLYHRNLVFTQPVLQNVITCDPFFGFCFNQTETVNQVLAQFGTYKGGFNVGGGFSFRLGESPFKFYTEARYHQMFNSGTDMKFIPITFGIRW